MLLVYFYYRRFVVVLFTVCFLGRRGGSPEYKTDLFVTISLQWAHIAISWNMDIPFTPSEYYEIPGFLFCFLYYCCLL